MLHPSSLSSRSLFNQYCNIYLHQGMLFFNASIAILEDSLPFTIDSRVWERITLLLLLPCQPTFSCRDLFPKYFCTLLDLPVLNGGSQVFRIEFSLSVTLKLDCKIVCILARVCWAKRSASKRNGTSAKTTSGSSKRGLGRGSRENLPARLYSRTLGTSKGNRDFFRVLSLRLKLVSGCPPQIRILHPGPFVRYP